MGLLDGDIAKHGLAVQARHVGGGVAEQAPQRALVATNAEVVGREAVP